MDNEQLERNWEQQRIIHQIIKETLHELYKNEPDEDEEDEDDT